MTGFLKAFQDGISHVPALPGRRVRILTGRSMAPFMRTLAPQLALATGAEVDVLEVVNRFYGELVSVAGLLAGEDLLRHIPETAEGDLILLPAEALNQDDLFIDSMPLSRFREAVAPARVLPALEITEALRTL